MSSAPPPPYKHPGPLPARPELPDGIVRTGGPEDGLPSDRRRLPHWPWWAPFAAFLLTIVVALVGATVVAVIAGLAGVDVDTNDPPSGVTIAGVVVQDLALIISAFILARATAGPPTPGQFGFRRTALRAAVPWTLAAWATFFVISAIWAAALSIDESDDLPQELGADESTLALIVVSVLVTVVAPVTEEVFFRGFMFTALRRAWGVAAGTLATGVAFGAVHAGSSEPEFLFPLAVFGAVLCLLYWKTNSLLPPMGLHALNNSLALGVSQDWTWEIPLVMAASSATILAVGLRLSTPRRALPAPAI